MKDIVKKLKRQTTDWKKICVRNISERFKFKIHKELSKCSSNSTIEKLAKDQNISLRKEDTQTANQHMK